MLLPRWLLIVTVCCAAVALVGCSGRPSRVKAASLDPEGAADEAMKLHDKNGDGQLDATEMTGCPGLASCAVEVDTNADKKVSKDELLARLKGYEASRVGLIAGIGCKLTQRGAPLADADVTLVPEPFLGADIERATGRSDSRGSVRFTIPGMPMPGVRPGMYRVEVSKKDSGSEKIAGEFNAQTRLGMEANSGGGGELKFAPEFKLDPGAKPSSGVQGR